MNLTKLFNKSIDLNWEQSTDRYQKKKVMPLRDDQKKKRFPVYHTTRRILNERFQVQRQKQYKTSRQVGPRNQPNKTRGWLKDQEGWTNVTKKLRVHWIDYQGLRYKGSKQFRDPVPKNMKAVVPKKKKTWNVVPGTLK